MASADGLPERYASYSHPFSWTGCYLGANVGYGWGRKDVQDNPASNFPLGTAMWVDTDGVLGGGQLGCNYQLSRTIVVGVEGDISAANLTGSHDIASSTFPVLVHASAETNWISTVTGRIGYSFERSMLYAKGGVAWAHDKYAGDWTYTPIPLSGSVSATETRSGFTFGLGFEHAIGANWSVKLEYDYMNFGTSTVTMPVFAQGTFQGNYVGDIDQTIHTVKAGINYRF
jgi:outer membrane immunogenic protein